MFLRRALRYRRSQALVLAGVSLLIGACATFAPWFARAVEQTVATEMLAGRPFVAAWQLEARPTATSEGPVLPPEALAAFVPEDLRPLFTPPVHGQNVEVSFGARGNLPSISGKLTWREGYCAKLVLVAGTCPRRANEVIASTVDQHAIGIGVGSVLRAKAAAGGGTLTVVGIYRPADVNDPYWFGRPPTGHSRPERLTAPAESDHLLTERVTFEEGSWRQRSTVDVRPIPGVARLDDLDRLREATLNLSGAFAEQRVDAQNNSGLLGLIDAIEAERRQATTIIPLVMVQVGLFAVVVLALALTAVVDQRRPELALARLRGASAQQAWRSLTTELGTSVTGGMLGGAAVGFGLLLLARATWLDGGSPVELPWLVPVVLVVAICGGLGVVAWTVRAAVRQPIATLLRRVAPRRRRALSPVDVGIIVLASAGLVAALTGGGRGPLPVLTPTLLALAAGLTFAHLFLPAATLVSRRALARGRLGLALGALQISRRPAVTRIVAVVTVATALVSFAGQASSVAAHNRELRAGYETGADGVLTASVTDLGDFTEALDAVDPDRQWLTPVVVSRAVSPDALRTMMIEPDSFRRIAFHGSELADAATFAKLTAPADPAPLVLRGNQLRLTVSSTGIRPVEAPLTIDGRRLPPMRSVTLQATVVDLRGGRRTTVDLDPLPLVEGRTYQLGADISCSGGCGLLRLGIARNPGDTAGAEADIEIRRLGTDSQPTVPLGAATDWRPLPELGGDLGSIATKTTADGNLVLRIKSVTAEQHLQHASVPVTLPALVTSGAAVSDATTVPGLDGIAVPVAPLDGLRGPVNRHSEQTAVADLESLRRLGGSIAPDSTEFEVWLDADGLTEVDRITKALADAGIAATLTDRLDERLAAYGRSASALALQLTPVVGIAAWSLAVIVLVLMVVTTWRSRAQDYASLRITGVPGATTARASRWEQTGPVVLAVLLGSICGVAGASIALPLIPLFAETGAPSPIPLDLATNATVALVLWAIGTAVLTTTTLLLGTGVNRRARYSRIREEVS